MRKNNLFVVAGFGLLLTGFASCSKGGGSGGGTTPPPDASLTVSVNKTSVRADNFDELVFTVKDQSNADVTSASTIRVNGTAISGNKYYASAAGNLVVKATKGSAVSGEITVTATDPGPAVFTQKLLTEDYTGTWCGYCPRVGQSLKIYSTANSNCIVVGIHGPAGSSDPYNYQYVTQLVSAYGITGFPSVIVNRNAKWAENSSELDAELVKRAPLGLGLETTVNGSTINVKAKVKFDVTTQIPMKLIVMLVEDGLVYPQVNYYAPTYGSNPIGNYAHKNTLRKAATDIFGDDIPAAQQVAGTTWEKDLAVSAAGYNMANCKIVATVIYGQNVLGRKGSLNTQEVVAGQSKNFD